MTELEAIEARHSVRQYKDIPVPEDVREQLKAFTDEV
ncbi:MAG: nitroreductase, partial [Lachnospiraceae bacterium]|nr:nitroreductase [Lachnospiraceae bacterium]